ncbi:cytochrome P450 704C1-like protein [Tanacetum coccineum]
MEYTFYITTIFLLSGFYVSLPFMLAVIGLLTSLLILLLAFVFLPYLTELMSTDHRPPVVGPITNQLIHFQHLYDYMTSIAKTYPTFRFITPTHSEVYTVDPVNVEYILKTNFANYTKGEYNVGIMKDLFGNGIFTVDGAKWRHQRKLASFEFSTKVLRDFSSVIFKSNTVKLVKKISLLAAAEKKMNLQDLLMKSTLDSIFKVGFGFDLDTLSGLDEASNRFIKAFDDSNGLVFWRFMDLFWRVKRYFNIGSEAVVKQNIRIIDNFLYELIQNKREQMKNGNLHRDKEDILSRFLLESEKDPENMNDEYLRDISLSFLLAGKDTSANTLTWFFYMLCKYPLIQEKVLEEVKSATEANDDISIDIFRVKLTQVALDKMHYLHSALTETLRLYPAVPLDGMSAEKDDVLPDGLKIKKGDGVGYMPYPMGRMTYIWGEDAENFRPERWLNNGVFHPKSPFKFTAFQGGPRICLGKEFAYRQMKILAAFLVYFFRFKLADENFEAVYQTMFTLHMDKGLHLPPVVGPITNLVIHFQELFDYITSLAKKHPTFRFITPTHSEVFTADPVNVEYILKTNFSNYTKGEYNIVRLKDLFDFSTVIFKSNSTVLAKKISFLAAAEKSMNLQDLLLKSTLDSIFKVGFGFDLDTLSGSDEASNRFMKAFDDSNELVYWRYVDLLWRVKRYLNIGREAALKENIRIIDKFLYEIIRNKREQLKNRNLYHPLIQEKVAEEVRVATEADSNTSIDAFGFKLTEVAIDKMHYLHAALSETMRLYPAVPLDRKSVEKDDVLPDGFIIKKGGGLCYMPYPMGRLTYIWGEDAEDFRPERWLNNGVFRPQSPFKFTAFQAGPRICLGKEFAYRQMKILAAFLVYFFKFKLVDPSKEATYRTMFTLHMDNGLPFIFALTGFYISPSLMLAVIGLVTSFLVVLLAMVPVPYFTELTFTKKRPPVPVVGPITILVIHFHELFDYMTTLAKKYPTFRFIKPTRSEVYTADPVNVEYILKTNFENYTKWTEINGAINESLQAWSSQLKFYEILVPLYSKCNTIKLAEKISLLAAAEKTMDLQDLLLKSTLESIFKVGFGFDLDTLSGLDEASNQFMKAFDDSNELVYRRFVDILWKVKRYLNIGQEAALKDNVIIIDKFVDKEDILSRFLMESYNDPENTSDKYLRDISLNFVIAGKGTTANTLTWFFYMLSKHPLIQEKIAEEVKTEADKNTTIDEFGFKLTEVALDKMHYLHAALTETLRLYPAVPLDIKSAENDDVLPDGFKIKKGDGIAYMPYPMGRMTYIWGEDAQEFRPERWLNNGVFRPESPFRFTAFQGGPRICLGKEFAYRQMKILAAFLVYFFKFKRVVPSKEATYRTMFTLHMDGGLHLYASSRF